MKIELLYIEECPNSAVAGKRVKDALSELDSKGVELTYTLISNAPDIVGTAFGGSPTIALDGVDLFPGEPAAELSCRVYPTPDGLAGVPTVDQIESALIERGFA